MENDYIPKVTRIERIKRESPDIKTLYLRHSLDFIPGQFLEVSCFGTGEAPISIASSPREDFLKLSFKRVGTLTSRLFKLKEKDSIGIRGPFGNGFPVAGLYGKDLIFIAGGIGLAPLRSLLKFISSFRLRKNFGKITLLYGSRSSAEFLYKEELKIWSEKEEFEILLTVDKADTKWKANTGVVTQLLNKVKIEPAKTKALICGPLIMMRFSAARLLESGVRPCDIILSLERHMKCGLGKCGHCYIADKFVCRDGPVFTYEELNSLTPAEILG